jgi:hypothetical protein
LLRLPVWVDTQFYTSLFAAAIDNEFSVSNFIKKIKQNSGSPFKYSGHTIILDSWLKEHPEYKSKSDEVEK